MNFNLTDSCKCLIRNLRNEVENVPFSKEMNEVVKIFYDKFINSEEYLKTLKYKCSKNENYMKPNDFSYIIKDIREYINEKLNKTCYFETSMYSRIIRIRIFYKDTENLDKIIYQILFWLHVILSFTAHKECSKELNIFLYLTLLKKELPETGLIEKINVNTGFTTSCQKKSNIVIFRKEEWFKVFLHETFHNLGLDFSQMENTITKKLILEFFPVDSEVKLYEAYTDAWAKILNCFVSSYLTSSRRYTDFLNLCKEYLLTERIHCFFQALKILDFMNLSYRDLYKNDEISKMIRKNYKEKTSVLSYYIINAILLNDFNGFISWCIKNNYDIIQFDLKKEKQISFCNYIKENHKTTFLLQKFDYINSLLLEYKKKENKDVCFNYLLYNMRKSLIEIE